VLDLVSLSKTLRAETKEIIVQSAIEEMTSANKTVLRELKDSIDETRTLEVASPLGAVCFLRVCVVSVLYLLCTYPCLILYRETPF
jgi:hypothetical protein